MNSKFEKPGIMELDLASVDSTEKFFSVVAKTMNLPDYFGRNWNALQEGFYDFWWLNKVPVKYLIIKNCLEFYENDPVNFQIFIKIIFRKISISIQMKKFFRAIVVDNDENLLKLSDFISSIRTPEVKKPPRFKTIITPKPRRFGVM